MVEPLTLLLAIVLANNLVLTHRLGGETLVAGEPDAPDRLLALGVFTTISTSFAAAFGWSIDHLVLQPFALGFLRTPAVILVVALTLWLVNGLITRLVPRLLQTWLALRWLVVANSALLGIALLVLREARDFSAAILLGLGGGLAFTLVLLLFAGLRQRLTQAQVPAAFRGAPVELLTAALMALACMGLSGLERHV
jgi:electron transport complex protein RnfA